jgi:hypothetical protein
MPRWDRNMFIRYGDKGVRPLKPSPISDTCDQYNESENVDPSIQPEGGPLSQKKGYSG